MQLAARSRLSEVLHFVRQDELSGGVYELFFVGVLFVERLCSLCYWRGMVGEKNLSMSVPNGTDEVKQSEVECPLRWFSNQSYTMQWVRCAPLFVNEVASSLRFPSDG